MWLVAKFGKNKPGLLSSVSLVFLEGECLPPGTSSSLLLWT